MVFGLSSHGFFLPHCILKFCLPQGYYAWGRKINLFSRVASFFFWRRAGGRALSKKKGLNKALF
ncbi:MAG: hypothetical protein BM485_14965 [Desulfobulbaceae bacterium DB1]|nr:MAG: hypothetical protein BM485_14965 [Desulfobulbaceae bacterium DB1]